MNEDVSKLLVLRPEICAKYKDLREEALNTSWVDVGNDTGEKENRKHHFQEEPLSSGRQLAYKATRKMFRGTRRLRTRLKKRYVLYPA